MADQPPSDLPALVASAMAWFNSLSPEQQAAHREAQRQSYIRSITEWPKPNFHWENGVKVYDSFADYCND